MSSDSSKVQAFNEKFNFDDIIIRRIIAATLKEMNSLICFYQRTDANTLKRIDVPVMLSVSGSEQFLRDKFIYELEGEDKAQLNYESVPRCVLKFSGIAIKTQENTNRYTQTRFVKEVYGTLRECMIKTEFVPVDLSFSAELVSSNVNEMFKLTECLVSRIYHNINAFTVDAGIFNMDAAISPVESYQNTYNVEFQSNQKKEFKTTFDIKVSSFLPCFADGILLNEIDEALTYIKNPENNNGIVEFYRDKDGIVRARLNALTKIDVNFNLNKDHPEVHDEFKHSVKPPYIGD